MRKEKLLQMIHKAAVVVVVVAARFFFPSYFFLPFLALSCFWFVLKIFYFIPTQISQKVVHRYSLPPHLPPPPIFNNEKKKQKTKMFQFFFAFLLFFFIYADQICSPNWSYFQTMFLNSDNWDNSLSDNVNWQRWRYCYCLRW